MPFSLYPHTSFFAPTYLLLALLCKVQYRQLLIVTGKILYPLYLLVIAPFSLACFFVNYLISQTHSKVKLKPVFFSVCLFLVSFSCHPQTKKHLLLCNALVGIPKCYSCFKAHGNQKRLSWLSLQHKRKVVHASKRQPFLPFVFPVEQVSIHILCR